MSLLAPLWAQKIPEGLIWLAIFIVFGVVPAIFQMINKQGQKQRRRQRPKPDRQQPPVQAVGARPQPPQGAGGGMEGEIEEFLRRAAQPRGRRPAARPAAEPAAVQEDVHNHPVGAGMPEHVGERLDRSEFQRRSDQLGGEVAQADEQAQERLHQVFDHQVGQLAETPGESPATPQSSSAEELEGRTAELPSTAAAGLAALFSNADNIRQAIVINEVLTRPEDRWA